MLFSIGHSVTISLSIKLHIFLTLSENEQNGFPPTGWRTTNVENFQELIALEWHVLLLIHFCLLTLKDGSQACELR